MGDDSRFCVLPATERIEALLECRAADTPGLPALVEESSCWSYAELNRDSEAIACRVLESFDGCPPRRIAIRMRRSALALEAMFAALKLGAAFLPIDPAAPALRSAAALDDARPELLLVDSAGEEAAAPADQVMCLNGGTANGGRSERRRAGATKSAADPAHILYTSGSSGAPKGVVAPHAALLNRLRWMSRCFPGGDGDLYCASGAIGFVDTITALFSGLVDGVPVFLPPDPPLPPRRFAELIHDAGVTRLTLVPSVLRDLLNEVGEERRLLAGVRTWILSGEPLPVELVRTLREIAPGTEVLNLYGSTEVAGDVTAHLCSGRETGLFVPAGKPIDGVEVRVLNRHGRELPIGFSGEVVVSGEALALGYLGDEELTRERFRDSGDGAPRQFRTGDLGRRRPDGSLELLGRADRQIKLNGVRVEPGEVEGALAAHPAVREAAVCAIDRPDGSPRLAAFVVGEAPGPELRAFLAGRLPSALVPGVVVSAPRLPRTASGKVDYLRLEAEARARDSVPLRTDITSDSERAVVGIWQEVLGIEGVGLDDDFFELGGDSLTGARVLARMRERLGARMDLRELFDFSTPRQCAARVEAETSRRDEAAGVGH